jgi:hypothetical protein
METAANKKSSLALGVIASMIAWVSTCLLGSAAIASSVVDIDPKTRAEVFGRFTPEIIERSDANPVNSSRNYDASNQPALECIVAPKGVLGGANFAQKTFSETFSAGGKFAGKTIDDVADMLRKGTLKPSDIPLEYATQGGQTLILNTRSAESLRRAGIPRELWQGIDVSNDPAALARLAEQLRRNGLGPGGIPNPRPSGGGN